MGNKILIVVITAIAGLIIWVGMTFYKAYEPKALVLQGEIDAQTYNISSKLPGRISAIEVKKGDMVQKGDLIFAIASPEAKAKLKQAKAGKAAAGAQRKAADNGARKQEIQAAQDQWKKAGAAEALMQKTYKRIEKLYKDGVVAQQKRDEVYTKWQASKYTKNAAAEMYAMAKEGARSETKEAAAQQERAYDGKVDEVEAYIKEMHQYAFHSGEVSQVLIHEGELTPVGFPVVTLVDISDSWAKFHVREDLLHYFKKDKLFHVKIPALENRSYDFRVAYIAVMGDFATWRAAEAGKGFDMKSFEVELRPAQTIEGLRVGMTLLLEL